MEVETLVEQKVEQKVEVEPKVETLVEPEVFCNWFTYKKKCGTVIDKTEKYCKKHKHLLERFEIIKKPKDFACSTTRDFKIIPRSKQYIYNVYDNVQVERTDLVDVYFQGGYVEEGCIENELYVELTSDNTKYYYQAERKQLRAKTLKIMVKEYCVRDPIVYFKDTDTYYCLECYTKFGKKDNYNFPHHSLFSKK
jgi:hypothetical protein